MVVIGAGGGRRARPNRNGVVKGNFEAAAHPAADWSSAMGGMSAYSLPLSMYQQQVPPPPAAGIPMSPNAYQQQGLGSWNTGLCGCTEDVADCCITWCCPCITFGQIAEIVDRGSTSCGTSGALYGLIAVFTGCQWIYSCTYRSKFRAQYSLPEDPCNDCLLHFCCEACALCQMSRELKHRGFDLSLGWHGNIERQPALAATQPPIMHGAMKR